MRGLLAIALFAAVTPFLNAQRMASASSHFARSYHPHGSRSRASSPMAFYDYSDYFPDTDYPADTQPFIVVQSPAPAVPVPERASAPAEPLLIELQGDRYLRVSGSEPTQTEMLDRDAEISAVPNPGEPVATRPAAVAVLIFRDGRREEVSDYAIAADILYADGNYYASGYWKREIGLSLLDLPATVAFNQSRGVIFRLPTSPNEVMVGP